MRRRRAIGATLSQPPPTEFAYGSLEAALVDHPAQLSRRAGIRVTCVSPGPILALGGVRRQVRATMPDMDAPVEKTSSSGRPGAAGEVARAVAFLAGPAAGYCTGTDLRLDGGALESVTF